MNLLPQMKADSHFAQWLFFGLAMLIFGAVVVLNLYSEHNAIDAEERARLATLARVVDQNLGRQLVATNLALNSIRSDLPYLKAQKDGRAQGNHRLHALQDAMPGVRTLNILDAEGTVIASGREELVGQNFRDRQYFQIARQSRNPAILHVSPPFKTVLGVFAINLVKVVIDDQGQFDGIVSATVDPEYFSTLMSSVIYAADMRSTLIQGDGQLILRVPDPERVTGVNVGEKPSSHFIRHMKSGQSTNAYVGVGAVSGQMRVLMFHTIQPPAASMDKPLVIALSREIPALFASWRRDAYKQSGLFGLLLLSTALGLFFYQRRKRAFARISNAFEDERKRAENALRESEVRFRDVAEAAGGYTWEFDLDDRYTFLS